MDPPCLQRTSSRDVCPHQKLLLVRAFRFSLHAAHVPTLMLQVKMLKPTCTVTLFVMRLAGMYEVIEAAEGIDESNVPSEAYIPSADGLSHTSIPGSQTQPKTFPAHGSSTTTSGYPVGGGAGKTLFDADAHDGGSIPTPPAEKAAKAPAGEF